MMNEHLMSLSISEASELFRNGDLSPVELTRAHLERIDQIDQQLNSFITVVADSALGRAKLAEDELLRTNYGEAEHLSPLNGIPLAVKDLYETSGVRTTHGSRFFADYIPESNAVTVNKLLDAGAVILGKNNMHEIALGLTNVNEHYGPCCNPWALDRIPGGSSGGSAAAVSAGLCMGSLGSDTGGSIRVPAALCGVVGIKPTYGRVSMRGVIPLSWNLDHTGPIARRVIDVAILLQTIAGYDPLDPYSAHVPVSNYTAEINQGIKGWRIAHVIGDYLLKTMPDIERAVNQSAEVFAQLGAQVETLNIDDLLRQSARASGLMVISDAAALHQERIEKSPQAFGKDVLKRLRTGAEISSTEYILARRTQTLMRWEFERLLDEYEVLFMPTTPIPAVPIDGLDPLEQARLLTRYTSPFNLTGLPALSLPCGFSSEGLPIGLQIISSPWGEAKVLRAAYAYEMATSWHNVAPDL